MSNFREHRRLAAFSVLLASIILSSCGSGAAPGATPTTVTQVNATATTSMPASTATVSNEGSNAGPITIKYWSSQTDAPAAVEAKIISAFETTHPNVTIEQVFVPFDDMSKKLPPAISTNTGPDIVYADVAPQFLGSYVKSKQILPLDDAFKKYGWDKTVFGWAQKRATYDGHIYAVGNEVEDLLLMYNKKIFDELGLQVPTSLEDLEATMATIKQESSYTPMMLATGASAPWNGVHMMNAIPYATMDVSQVLNTTPQGTGSYLEPEWLNSFKVFDRWVKAGYFPKDANSIDWEGHWSLFCSGKVAMLTQGTWLFKSISDCAKENPDKFDWKVAPFPVAKGRPFQAYVGIGSGWFLSASVAKDPQREQATLEFLGALTDPNAATMWVQDAQIFPAVPFDQSKVTLTEQQKVALQVIDKAGAEGGGPVPIGFNNSPAELDVWKKVLQGIVAGSDTPENAVKMLNDELVKAQAAWKSNK
jgi:raffinose/stachyose/melibiose transport system substrate-binding protein